MGGKSKRYFANSRERSRSKSPDRNFKSHRSSSSSTQHLKHQNKYRSESNFSNKYSDNKFASDRLKKVLQDQTKDSRPSAISTVGQLSIEEQLKRANAIEEINYNPFVPKSFLSNRIVNPANAINIDTSAIPLPKEENAWHENPKLLIDPSVSLLYEQMVVLLLIALPYSLSYLLEMQMNENKNGMIISKILWKGYKNQKHEQISVYTFTGLYIHKMYINNKLINLFVFYMNFYSHNWWMSLVAC